MRQPSLPRHLLAILLAGLPFFALADSQGSLIRASELKAKPFIDAPTVASLPDNAPVTVVANQGGWSQVKTKDGSTGWVRLLNVKLTKADDGKSDGNTLSQIGGVIRTGTTKSAATTGAKGLTKEDIANSRPNPSEVQKLETFKLRPVDVDRFAASRKLNAKNVPEL
ncbi:SH3 domain-containing protein [Azonexus sp. IMCC34839]|uniref:SH3 domain-containing protein n=1 Tax=Azonexus sp. IMCC34839 TaxID=3133695 RepID=UPI003999FB76